MDANKNVPSVCSCRRGADGRPFGVLYFPHTQPPPVATAAPPPPRFDLDRYAAREARIQRILWAIAFAIVGAIVAFIIGWL